MAFSMISFSRIPSGLLLRRVISTALLAHSNNTQPADILGDQNHQHSPRILRSGLQRLKGDIDQLKANLRGRGLLNIDVDELVLQFNEYRKVSYRLKKAAQARNIASKQIKQNPAARDELITEAREIKKNVAELENEMLKLEQSLYEGVIQLPNNTHPKVPVGDQDCARVVRISGEKPKFDFEVHNHVDIGERTDIIDLKAAANAIGRNFYYLKGIGAELELALIQYAMKKAKSRGYKPIITPDIVTTDLIKGCGFNPRDHAHAHLYELHPDHHPYKCLTGTAEIPLAGLYMDKVLSLQELPIRLVAFGRCFRAEAGGFGKRERGLYRVHQFSKVELFAITANETGEESEELLKEMVDIQEEINTELGLHYKVLEMPTEELGAPAYHKIDIEAWMPGMEFYGEITSASNCTDYQSLRLNITYKSNTCQNKTCAHTVNGTACAVPRTIVAILENYQNKDGTVIVPKVLQPFIEEDIINSVN